ncbi:MAG: hypothetical protein QNJ16_14960 [Rhodobacter sp.]|nr:hypothetical protein [Rhodobacter sp.]
MSKGRNAFVIFGRVIDPTDKSGLAGLTVEALDKDLIIDDRLGTTKTNKDGSFEIVYDKSDFQELFFDAKPDIYIQLRAPSGEIVFTSEERVRHQAAQVEEFTAELPRHVLEHLPVEHSRRYFKQLITINPNYFGTLTESATKKVADAVVSQSGSTKYEALRCAGLMPDDDLLEAVLEVKLPYGFKSGLCGDGSKEYVAFYLDYDDGTGFVSAGPPAEVTVHDLMAVDGDHLFYAVRRAFTPKEILGCDQPQIVRLRAILSWENIPTGPSFTPVWGNVIETWIQIRPKAPLLLPVFPDINIPMIEMIEPVPEALEIPIPVPDPEPVFSAAGNFEDLKKQVEITVASLEEEKASGEVEEQRFEFVKLIGDNPNYFGALSESKEPEVIQADLAKLPQMAVAYLTDKYQLDVGKLTPIFPQNPKTKFEELTCVGLYPDDDLLEATFTVKRPNGYQGNLCSFGSWEYVTFYIDWGTSGWQYVDTARLRVHNIPSTDKKPLSYAVRVTIPNAEDKLKLCTQENVVRVRAILSWNHDPSPYGPGFNPSWGNVLDRSVQIRPQSGSAAKAYIEIVNDVHQGEIAQSGADTGYAWDPADTIPPLDHNRPFGGIIAVWGKTNVSGAAYYRFRYSSDGGTTWNTITDPRYARNPAVFPPVVKRVPVGDGWFSRAQYQTDVDNYTLSPLIHWRSYGLNGEHILRLELANAFLVPLPGKSSEITVHLDNTGIDFFDFGGTPANLPMSGVAVKDSSGNFKKCESFEGAASIHVLGNFRDDHFRHFDVTVFGGNIPTTGTSVGSGSFRSPVAGVFDDQGILAAANGGAGKEIAQFDLCSVPQTPERVKCAYAVRLRVWDRAIVGSVSGYEFNTHSRGKTGVVTFDWDPAGQC